ncbi:TPA: alpha-glucosidase C-terminal domain-containing protein [Candidatus Avigastranaerophilus faecigallinarum]|nr:alpha-glucosidase C-terminal domain-containing protein [Candidatus Avigastranaerophilus faecigallinarum]
MKKLLISILVLSVLFNYTIPAFSFTGGFITNPKILDSVQTENIVSANVEKRLKTSIAKVYGDEQVDEIYVNILKIIKETRHKRSEKLKQEDLSRSNDWYKDEIIYMFYVDQFGVDDDMSPNTFYKSVKMLRYLKDLGVTTIYMLPFADSPMGDAGFDVRNPRDVRKDLGGMQEFIQFITEAKRQGFKIKSDLVLNHFSEQHEWFKEAQNGDLNKLDYFVVSEKEPEKKVYKDEKIGYIAEYKHDSGKISKRRLIFPEITQSNYRKVTINGKDYYLYHTFYPFQLDINWENPQVLYYNLETIAFWANLGIDIFRMDAIPYLIKEEGTNAENLPKTHEIIKILSTFLQETAPRSVIQVEACQPPKKLLPYFGTENKVEINIDNKIKELTRTNEAQIAYHFPYMPAIWATIVSGDNSYFWKTHKKTPQIPDSASWAVFLRVHDELTLEMVNKETRELLYEDLADKGAEFRKGFGISGRLANFLDNDIDRINMTFAILLSLKGIPIIYYGDEIGSQNNFSYAQRWAKIRERRDKKKNKNSEMLSYFDSRDIHRGAIKRNTFYRAMYRNNNFNSKIYKNVKRLIEVRKNYNTISRGDFIEVKSDKPQVFSYLRKGTYDKILMVNNLSDKKVFAELDTNHLNLNETDTEIKMQELITKEPKIFIIENKKLIIKLKPYETMWLSFK